MWNITILDFVDARFRYTDEVKRCAAHSSQSTGRSILFSDQVVLVDDGQPVVVAI